MNVLRKLIVAGIALAALSAGPAYAESREWWPGATHDPKVPTPKSVFGYEMGEYWTEHVEMTAYMRQLEQVTDRVKVFSVGRTNERRELLLVAISAPANLARLEEIRTTIERLRDPRTLTTEAARAIAKTTPAVAWMNFGNDGNESAALETAIQMVYHLASGTDETTRRILDEVVTIIYPSHNPESHARYVSWMKASATGNPDPVAQEHRGDWRMDTNNNHFQIDLNRDAVFASQIETQVIVRELHRWNPVLFIDYHGNPDRFFFPPWALPINAQVGDASRKAAEAYGRNIAAAFDRHGWTYWTRQVFDLHYPGYWDSYPSLNGAIGMTFETDGGGNKGLAYRLPDGRITTLGDAVLRHFTGGIASLVTTAERREERLMALYEFRASGMADVAREPVKQFVLVPGADAERVADLIDLLRTHQIEVYRAGSGFAATAGTDLRTGQSARRSFDAGVFVIPANQPQKRLLRTLLDPATPMDEEFLDEVRRLKAYNDALGEAAPRKPYGFYDINVWSLPIAYGVEAYWTTDAVPTSALERVTARTLKPPPAPERARFGYLFPWNTRGGTRLVGALWKEEFQVSLAREPFTQHGRSFASGTVLVRTEVNPDTLHARITALAREFDVDLFAVQGAMVESGRDLGDRSVVDLKAPKVLLVSEPPTSVTAFGAIWFLLDRAYGQSFTIVRAQDLASVRLHDFDVIVLPDGQPAGYGRVFGEEGAERLKRWVQDGGTLVAVKGAAVWASGERVGLTSARDVFTQPAGEGGDARRDPPRRIDVVPGVFVSLDVDTDHPFGVGMPSRIETIFRSNVIFSPTKRGARVATLDRERPVVAGFHFDEAKEYLPGAPFMWHEPTGRGHVVLFADDVTFRTFLWGAHRLFLNSVLLAPSF